MEDMAAKIQDILSDEESMKQLSELAQMFSSDENNECNESETTRNSSQSQENIFPDFDISMLMKLQGIMGKTNNDETTGLLLALKPLLKEERQHKVDKAVKILRLLAVWDILKDSGLMNDFLG
jgi:hypothetical protein